MRIDWQRAPVVELALLAGFEVAGVLGGLFAVPAVVVAWVLVGAL